MSFWDAVSDLPAPVDGSAGPAVGFFEAFTDSYDYSSKALARMSGEYHFQQIEEETLNQIHERTGKRIKPLSEVLGYQTLAGLFERGQDLSDIPQKTGFGQEIAKTVQEFEAARLEAMPPDADPRPGLLSYKDMWGEVHRRVAEIATRKQATDSRPHTVMGQVGSFLGSSIGSTTIRDPLPFASLFVGGFGGRIATRVATEMGIVGLSEFGNQFVGMKERRQNVGMPWSVEQAFVESGFATAGAGILRGGAELIGAGFRRLTRSEQAAADYAKENLDVLRETNPQRDAPPPVERAGQSVHAEAMDRLFNAGLDPSAPLPLRTAPATRPIREELLDSAADLRPAVADVIESSGASRAVAQRIANEMSPEVLTKFRELTDKLENNQAAIAKADVELADEAQFGPLRKTLAEIEELEKTRAAAEQELANNIDPFKTPKLQKQLATAEKKLKKASAAVDQKLLTKMKELETGKATKAAEIEGVEAQRGPLAEMVAASTQRQVDEVFSSSPARTSERVHEANVRAAREAVPHNVASTMPEEKLIAETEEASDALQRIDDQITEDMTRVKQTNRLAMTKETESPEPVQLDLGFGQRIDPATRVLIETEKDVFEEVSARTAFDRFKDEDDLLEAMKVCSI